MAQLTQTNPNGFKNIEKALKQLDGYEAKIGWFDNARYPDGTPVAYVAAIQEYGHGPIPPRLGLRGVPDKHRDEWKENAAIISKRVLAGQMTGLKGMQLLAEAVQNDVLDRITSNPPPPLKPLTLAIRRQRELGKKITGSLVGELARKLDEGKYVPLSANTRALDDTNTLISHLDNKVEKLS